MTVLNFLMINAAAVGLMTLFTYLISYLLKINLGEPELLTQLINRTSISKVLKLRIWAGWIMHYSIGMIFLFGYLYFRTLIIIEPEQLWGLLYGVCAGCLGIVGWKLMFYLHPNPPRIPKRIFFFQLLGAHIVFSLTISLIISH